MGACWPLQLPPVTKSVLISLADNANDHGACWPAISTICKRTCYGKTAVIDAIADLERRGLLIADRSNGRHSKYTILVGQPDLFSTGTYPQAVRHTDRTAKTSGASGGVNRTATRTAPDRQADTNRKEPSLTVKSTTDASEVKIPPEEKSDHDDPAWRESLPKSEPRPARGAHRPAPKTRRMSDDDRRKNLAKNLPDVLVAAGVRRKAT